MSYVRFNRVPDSWPPGMCGEGTCLATATITACQEPEICNGTLCRSLVACDEHAADLAATVSMFLSGTGQVSVLPDAFGGHD